MSDPFCGGIAPAAHDIPEQEFAVGIWELGHLMQNCFDGFFFDRDEINQSVPCPHEVELLHQILQWAVRDGLGIRRTRCRHSESPSQQPGRDEVDWELTPQKKWALNLLLLSGCSLCSYSNWIILINCVEADIYQSAKNTKRCNKWKHWSFATKNSCHPRSPGYCKTLDLWKYGYWKRKQSGKREMRGG